MLEIGIFDYQESGYPINQKIWIMYFVAYCDANSSSYEYWAHKLAICGVHLDMD